MLTVNGVMDALFPTLRPEQQSPLRSLMAEQSAREAAFIAEHIAKRAPVLAREYAQNRAKVALALAEVTQDAAALVGSGQQEVVTATLMAGDFAEVGRLLAVRVDAVLREQAEDAAELEAQELLDMEDLS